ncbi:hypothetical protein ACOSQ2_021452 [Xanthoceras sorbifolium]
MSKPSALGRMRNKKRRALLVPSQGASMPTALGGPPSWPLHEQKQQRQIHSPSPKRPCRKERRSVALI